VASEGSKDFVRVLLAYFLPPVGVFLQVGLGMHFWINLILCFLFWIPGILHAVWVIASIGPEGKEVPNGMQTFISLVLAAFLPPVGVAMKAGVGMPLIINCVLTFFFWFPGMIHAAYVICQDEA
jgi:uncharacterized membrane protein YqaE (UPF0057 family)